MYVCMSKFYLPFHCPSMSFIVDSNRIWDNPYAGQVRLTGGSTVNKGLVEVYCNGRWVTCVSPILDCLMQIPYADSLVTTVQVLTTTPQKECKYSVYIYIYICLMLSNRIINRCEEGSYMRLHAMM